jgi:hypothetical protein
MDSSNSNSYSFLSAVQNCWLWQNINFILDIVSENWKDVISGKHSGKEIGNTLELLLICHLLEQKMFQKDHVSPMPALKLQHF